MSLSVTANKTGNWKVTFKWAAALDTAQGFLWQIKKTKNCTDLFCCFDLETIELASATIWPFEGFCPTLNYLNHAKRCSWRTLKSYWKKSGVLDVQEKVGTCLLWCRFSYLSPGLNVNAFFFVPRWVLILLCLLHICPVGSLRSQNWTTDNSMTNQSENT